MELDTLPASAKKLKPYRYPGSEGSGEALKTLEKNFKGLRDAMQVRLSSLRAPLIDIPKQNSTSAANSYEPPNFAAGYKSFEEAAIERRANANIHSAVQSLAARYSDEVVASLQAIATEKPDDADVEAEEPQEAAELELVEA